MTERVQEPSLKFESRQIEGKMSLQIACLRLFRDVLMLESPRLGRSQQAGRLLKYSVFAVSRVIWHMSIKRLTSQRSPRERAFLVIPHARLVVRKEDLTDEFAPTMHAHLVKYAL